MLNIRKATSDDIPLIVEFIRELAEYEQLLDQAVATAEDLRRDGFSKDPRFYVEIAEWEGEPAGFALWFYNYSTFQGKPGIYLEDLSCGHGSAAEGSARRCWYILPRSPWSGAAGAISGRCLIGTRPRSSSINRWAPG